MKKKKLLAATMMAAGLLAGSTVYSADYTTRQIDLANSEGDTFKNISSSKNGGALYNYTTDTSVNSSVFIDNETTKLGGAIYAGAALTVVGDSNFENNKSTNSSGGAIANSLNSATISNSTFENNTATTAGGAIYNKGVITFAGTNTFSGNKANGVANDIYNTGTLNIGGTATLDGGIDGNSETIATNLVNITGGLTETSAIKNQTVTVGDGESSAELHLTNGAANGSNLTGSAVKVNSGAVINTIDGVINDYSSQVTLNDGAKVKLDVSLAGASADKYNIESGGSVTVNEIKVLTDTNTNATVKIANSGDVSLAENLVAYTTANKYTVEDSTVAGVGQIKLTKAGNGGLRPAANETGDAPTQHDNVTYTLTANDDTTSDGTATITNADMTIIGNGTESTSNKVVLSNDLNVGASATDNSTLTLNEVKFEEGSTTAGKIVNNAAATLNINDSSIAVAINNAGTATIIDSTVGEIVNSGTMTTDPVIHVGRLVNAGTYTGAGDVFNNLGSASVNGGAIENSGTLTLTKEDDTNVPTFTGNSAAKGGAIYNTKAKEGDDIKVNISDAVFTKNTATGDGGAIYNAGAMTIDGATFGADGDNTKANTASTQGGGAIYNQGTLSVTDSKFYNNSAKWFGAIRDKKEGSGLTITNSTFKGNTAEETGAVGIFSKNGASSISGTAFEGNTATATGDDVDGTGALFIGSEASLTIDNTTFTNNTSAKQAGAIGTRNYSDNNLAKLDITNSTFTGNQAATVGGAINNYLSNSETNTGYVTISNTNFTSNSAANGGAIYNHGLGETGNLSTVNSAIKIDGGTFTKNTATGNGGAIYNAGTMTISGATFGDRTTANANTAASGGAIFIDTGSKNINVAINNTVFANNSATTYGGAIDHRMGTVNITGSTFSNNSAGEQGGAILERLQTANAFMTISDSTFTSNTAKSDGGAVDAFANLTIRDTNFTSNSVTGTSADGGGALFLGSEAVASVSGNGTDKGIFSSNTSTTRGGAIATRDIAQGNNVNGKLDITNVQFTGNQATTDGGAIYNAFYNDAAGDGYVKVTGSTFTNNSAARGGAVFNDGADRGGHVGVISFTDTNFANNTATTAGGAIYSAGNVTINALNSAVAFSGNTANGAANDIYMSGTSTTPVTLALNAASEKSITLGGGIDGQNYNINVNSATGNTGNVIFNGNVNAGALNVAAGTLTNNAGLTVKSGANDGTITGGDSSSFTLNDGGVTNPLVFENKGSFTQKSLTIESGNFKTDVANLHLTDDIKNDGTLTFTDTDTTDTVTIAQSIAKETSGGTVEIAGGANTVFSLGSDKSISDQALKLTSGTFDAGTATGAVDLTNFSSIIANGGTLSVVDNQTGTITLGNVDTSASALKVAMDANLSGGATGTADVLTGTSTSITGTNGIDITSLNILADPTQTEFKIHVADTSISDKISTETMTINRGIPGAGSLLLTYDTEHGDFIGTHSDLANAIQSDIAQKAYDMGGNEAINGPLTLGGTSLSITGNNKSIQSTDNTKDGIKIDNNGQTLSITGATVGDSSDNPTKGFATAIDNTAGGTVNLKDVTMTGNTTADVANAGTLNLDGTNSINTVSGTGTTNIKTGTSTIGSLTQNNAKIENGAALNIAADKLQTTNATDNQGALNLSAGDTGALASAITDSQTDKTGVTNIAGNVSTNGHNIEQATVNVGSDGSTTPVAAALTVTANDKIETSGDINVNNLSSVTAAADALIASGTNGVANAGTLNLSGSNDPNAPTALASVITDPSATAEGRTGKTNITGNVSTDKAITQKSVTVAANSSLTTAADKVTATDGINNAGTLNLTGSTGTATATALASAVTNTAGTTNIAGNVSSDKVIEQDTVNVGSDGTATPVTGSLTNTGTIKSDINVTTAGTLNQNGGDIGALTGGRVDINNAGTTNIAGGKVFADEITNNSGDTNISGGNVLANAITNAAGAAAGDDISITGGNVVATTIENAGKGTLDINQTDASGASTGSIVADAITNSDTGNTNIASKVNATDIIASKGAINVNADANSVASTSDLLANKAGDGAADITIAEGAKVAVTTDNDSLVVDNNVATSDPTDPSVNNGTLELTGNDPGTKFDPAQGGDPHHKADSEDVGTRFSVDPNKTVNADIDLKSGELATDGSNINGKIIAAADATVNAKDGTTSNVGDVDMANGAFVKTDVNALTSKSDTFNDQNQGNNKYLTDLGIQDLDKFAYDHKSINLTEGTGLKNLQMTDALKANLEKNYSNVLTPIRRMDARVQLTDDGLMLNFTGTGNDYKDFNPAVMASPVAAQLGGYLVQLNSYDQAFNNMDMYMLMTKKQRQALKLRNKIAATAGTSVAFDPTMSQTDYAGGWFRPYASFEKVGLADGPKVENNSWGTFLGGESSMKDLGHGWDGMWGAYIGYNGAHQNYDGVGIYENGGTLGLVGMAYKDNFFVGATVNGGMMAAQANTMYGTEDFNMVMAGIAAKTGYNWELADGKFIIQPSLQTSYSFVNTFDYHNSANVYLESDALHAITIEPGIKFIGNIKGGWQPYAGLSGVFTIMDRTHFHANDVSLPALSVAPYAKYGIGLRKTWGERFSGFFQMFLMSGGRNGFGMQGGFKWAVGADGKGHITKDAKNPELKKTTVNLQNKKASVK